MTDDTTRDILDATRASILDFGIQRTTLTDIARRAGVSRMTVYRRYADVDAILRELMTREFGTLMAELATNVEGEHARARLAAISVAVTRGLRDHPLLRKVLEAEPELMLPYLTDHPGGTQRVARQLIAATIAEGQRDGSIRAGDPTLLAQSVLLVAQSWLFAANTAPDVPLADLDAELHRVIDAALVP